jgi:hypothetical protein
MKKWQAVVGIMLSFGMLFSAANAFATVAAPSKPRQTPGAKATRKAEERATQGHGDNGNGQSGHNTPGATATEKAEARATKAVDKGQRVTYQGVVSAVGADSLTLQLAGGGSKTFHISASTRIHIPGLDRRATLADVHTGVRALVQVLKDDASLTALYVSIAPGKPEEVHRVGIVTAYTPGASITIRDKDGESFTFLITPQTKILPKDRANQLGIGSRVTIIARRDVTGGPLTAQGIVIHPHRHGATPTPTATATASANTATPTETATETATPTATPSPTDTPTVTNTATQTETPIPTDTATATPTP